MSLYSRAQNLRAMPPHRRLQRLRSSMNAAAEKLDIRRRAGRSREIRTDFHRLYYDTEVTWKQNSWFGVWLQQFPQDLYNYQEIIAKCKPDYIVQTGVCGGGSALFLAHMLDLLGAPETAVVIGIDIILTDEAKSLTHPRIRLIEGSSTAPEVVTQIEAILADVPTENGGMVSLDSDHTARHVAAELRVYPRWVGVGQYLIVEDTCIGNPVLPNFGPGPLEAMLPFLERNTNFQIEPQASRQLVSNHSWLKRIA